MRLPVTHLRSKFVRVALLSAVIAVVMTIGVASAATTIKAYTATVDQISQTEYRFAITNEPTSTHTFAAANVDVPPGFSISSVPAFATAPAGKTWTSRLNGAVLELRAANSKSGIGPDESVAVTLTATAACSGDEYPWTLDVRQANNFNGVLNKFTGNSPTLSVVGPPTTFQFGTIASPQVVGVAFPVTVTAKDACANLARFYTGSPTLSGLDPVSNGTQPTYAPLSFANANGVASTSVTAVQSQFGARLTATDGTATGTSDPSFDVVDRLCKQGQSTCTANHGDGTRVTAPVPPAGATTKLSLSGPGKSFTCAGTTYPNIGSHVTVDPDYPEGETTPIEIAIEWSLAGAPAGSRVVCMTKDDLTFVVPKCGRTPVPPCESSRSRSGDILRATFLIAPTDPGWSLG